MAALSAASSRLVPLWAVAQTLWELLRAALSIVRGTFENREQVWLMDGSRFEVATNKPKQIHAAGEMKTRTPARFSVEKALLPVFAPPETEPSDEGQTADAEPLETQ